MQKMPTNALERYKEYTKGIPSQVAVLVETPIPWEQVWEPPPPPD